MEDFKVKKENVLKAYRILDTPAQGVGLAEIIKEQYRLLFPEAFDKNEMITHKCIKCGIEGSAIDCNGKTIKEHLTCPGCHGVFKVIPEVWVGKKMMGDK